MASDLELKEQVRAALEAVTRPAPWLAAAVHRDLEARLRAERRTRIPRRFRPALTAIAAVALVALAVGAVGTFLAARPHVVPGHGGGGVIFPIKMVGPADGWGMPPLNSTGPTGLFHTDDGGTHWTDVTPAGWNAGVAHPFFLDATRAWVAFVSTKSSQVELTRTIDGGRTWQRIAAPGLIATSAGMPGLNPQVWINIGFVDPLHGWLEGLTSGPGIGIYRTQDGGVHWSSVPVVYPANADSCGQISFSSVTTAWMECTWITTTGSAPTDRISGPLFVTRTEVLMASQDGGETWQRQSSLPAPNAQLGQVAPIHFFDATHGVVIGDLQGHLAVASTSDGGATWTVHNAPESGWLTPTFVDTAHGWTIAVSESDGSVHLYRTDDGGASWAIVPADSLFTVDGPISQVYFVDQHVGFAERDAAGTGLPSQLLRTSDGGVTWSILSTAR